MFVEGVREKARVEFDTWLHQDTDSERVCCVTGPLGSGKTTLAAEFCGVEPGEGTRDVKKQRREGEEGARLITAFHFFQGGGTLALNKCWVEIGRQLAGQLGYDIRSEVSTKEDGLFVFRRLVAEPLTRLSKPSNKIVVLVDGADKLPWETHESFWEIVSQTWERETPMWVHLAVFSYTTLRLSGAIRWIDLQDEDHEKDIELLCNARLASFMQDEEDVQYATKHIVRHSTDRPSVLLYTSCVLDALLEDRSHRSVTLDDIWEMEWRPECLVHAFRPYLINFLDHVIDGDIDQYQQLLSCLSAARTPLSIDVAAEVLEMNNESLTTLLSRSTSLVYQEDDAIKFAHPCLKDVVQHRRCGKHPDGSSLHVNARRGHEWFVDFLQASPTSPLALRDMFYHLCSSRRWSAVPEYLLDFDWVLALVSEEGCALKLIEDADKLYNDKPCSDVCVTDVVRTIDLGLEAILTDSALLVQKIICRIPDETHPIRISYEASNFAQTDRAKCLFLPVTSSVQPVRSSFRKQLRKDGKPTFPIETDGRFVLLTTKKYSSDYWMWDSQKDLFFKPQNASSKVEIVGHCLRFWGGITDWRFGNERFSIVDETMESGLFSGALGEDVWVVNTCPIVDDEDAWDEKIRQKANVFVLKVYDLQTKALIQSIEHDIYLGHRGKLQVGQGVVLLAGEEISRQAFVCKRCYVWDYRTGECLWKKDGLYRTARASIFEDLVYFGSNDIWNWKKDQVEMTIPVSVLYVDLVRGLSYSKGAELKEIWTGLEVGYYPGLSFYLGRRLCIVMPKAELHSICSESSPRKPDPLPFSVVHDIDSTSLLVSNHKTVGLLSTTTGNLLQSFEYPPSEIFAGKLDQRIIVFFTYKDGIVIRDRATGSHLLTFRSKGASFIGIYEWCVVFGFVDAIQEIDPWTGNSKTFRLPFNLKVSKAEKGRTVLGTLKDTRTFVAVAYESGDVLWRLEYENQAPRFFEELVGLRRENSTVELWDRSTGKQLLQAMLCEDYVLHGKAIVFCLKKGYIQFQNLSEKGAPLSSVAYPDSRFSRMKVYHSHSKTTIAFVDGNVVSIYQRESAVARKDRLHRGRRKKIMAAIMKYRKKRKGETLCEVEGVEINRSRQGISSLNYLCEDE